MCARVSYENSEERTGKNRSGFYRLMERGWGKGKLGRYDVEMSLSDVPRLNRGTRQDSPESNE